MNRPERFDIPGVSPEWQQRIERAFAETLAAIPKPVNPEPEPQK